MRRENECWLVEREIGGMECEKMMGWDGMGWDGAVSG
jgi:hypothetical protein